MNKRHLAIWIERQAIACLQRVSRNRVQNPPLADGEPLVSVIVVSFNYGAYVERAVRSVLSQTLKNVELIVVDGGSTDGTSADAVRRLQGDRLVKLFQAKPCSVGTNRLLGLQHARGRYLVFLDADDELFPGYLEQAAFWMEAGNLDLLAPVGVVHDSGERRVVNLWWSMGASALRIFRNNGCNTASMFRRSFWHRHGIGYDESVELEDWDFWCRLAANGARAATLAAPGQLYYVHPGSLTRGLDRSYETHRSVIRARYRATARVSGRLLRIWLQQHRGAVVDLPLVNLGELERLPSVGIFVAAWTPAVEAALSARAEAGAVLFLPEMNVPMARFLVDRRSELPFNFVVDTRWLEQRTALEQYLLRRFEFRSLEMLDANGCMHAVHDLGGALDELLRAAPPVAH